MNVDIFTIAYNEEYLLPHFIDHYRRQFENISITVFDNQSTDNTKQIALSNQCVVKTFDTGSKIKDDHYTILKNSCWKNSKADFVIVCDVDEFLEVPFELNPDKHSVVNTHGYDIVGDVESRLGVFNPLYCKHIMFSPKHIKAINYSIGCHSCNPVGRVVYSSPATLMHRKYINEEYVYKKHLSYMNRLSDTNKKYNWGEEYQNVTPERVKEKFELLKNNAKLVL